MNEIKLELKLENDRYFLIAHNGDNSANTNYPLSENADILTHLNALERMVNMLSSYMKAQIISRDIEEKTMI
jgi:hypothetical protein